MVRGQARDLREPPPATLAALETLHAEKTAALFRAALELGAAAAGGSPDDVAALGRFGTAYGIAFQHADDRADADHPEHSEAARRRVDALVEEAVTAVAPWGDRGGLLAGFARALAPRGRGQ
jgi:geranylgeranyl pyrophosphate synthase